MLWDYRTASVYWLDGHFKRTSFSIYVPLVMKYLAVPNTLKIQFPARLIKSDGGSPHTNPPTAYAVIDYERISFN